MIGHRLRNHEKVTTMPPMARKQIEYREGTPQRAITDLVAQEYGENRNEFFRAVAAVSRKKLTPDSAKRAFYRLMNGGGLPPHHTAVYVELLGIDTDLIDQLTPVQETRTETNRALNEINSKLDLLLAHFGLSWEPGVQAAVAATQRLERADAEQSRPAGRRTRGGAR